MTLFTKQLNKLVALISMGVNPGRVYARLGDLHSEYSLELSQFGFIISITRPLHMFQRIPKENHHGDVIRLRCVAHKPLNIS